MQPWDRFNSFAEGSRGRVRSAFHVVHGQPGWVTRAALLVFLLVIGLPIIVLILLAFMLAAVVFGVLALVNAVVSRVRGGSPGSLAPSEGRENVRVIVRDERA